MNTTARHAKRHETWIEARALINRGWKPQPRRAYPERATLRHEAPLETRLRAAIKRTVRSLRNANASHGNGVSIGA